MSEFEMEIRDDEKQYAIAALRYAKADAEERGEKVEHALLDDAMQAVRSNPGPQGQTDDGTLISMPEGVMERFSNALADYAIDVLEGSEPTEFSNLSTRVFRYVEHGPDYDPANDTGMRSTDAEEADDGSSVLRVEFGSRDAAKAAREEYDRHLSEQDDRRYKTVVFNEASLSPGVVTQIEADAEEGLAESETRSHSEPLTDRERKAIKQADGFSQKVTTANWRSAKGTFTREGMGDRFRDAIGSLTDGDDPAELAESWVREAKQGSNDGDKRAVSGGARDEGEEDIKQRRRQQAAAQVVMSEEFNNARRWCKKGDEDACDALVEEFDVTREEAMAMLGMDVDEPTTEETTTQTELVTVGGDGEFPEMQITEAAAGALRDSWTSYKTATGKIEQAIETLREEVGRGRRSMNAINAIRDSGGQDEIEAEKLGTLLGKLAEMPGNIPNVSTLAEYGIFDEAGYADNSRSAPLDVDTGDVVPRGRTDMSRSPPLDVGPDALDSMKPAVSYTNEEGAGIDVYTRPDVVLAGGQVTPLSPVEAVEEAESEDRFTLAGGDPSNVLGEPEPEPAGGWQVQANGYGARGTSGKAIRVLDTGTPGVHHVALIPETGDWITVARNLRRRPASAAANRIANAITPATIGHGGDRLTRAVRGAFVDAAPEVRDALTDRFKPRSTPLDIDTTAVDPRGRRSTGPTIDTTDDAIEYLDSVVDGYGDRIAVDNQLRKAIDAAGLVPGAWTEQQSQDVLRYGIPATDAIDRWRQVLEDREDTEPEQIGAYSEVLMDFAASKAGYDRDGTGSNGRSLPLDAGPTDVRPVRRRRRQYEQDARNAREFRQARRMLPKTSAYRAADRSETLREGDSYEFTRNGRRLSDAAETPEREQQYVNAIRAAEAREDWERVRRLEQRRAARLDYDPVPISDLRADDDGGAGSFSVEQQQTFGGPEPAEEAQNEQVTLTGQTEGTDDARPAAWTPVIERPDRLQYDGGPVSVAAKKEDDGQHTVSVVEGSNYETIASDIKSYELAHDIAEEFTKRIKPPEVSLHKGDAEVPQAAAEAKKAASEARSDEGLGAF